MGKIGVIIFCIVLVTQGNACGQSLLDSVFGAGGLGIWGGAQQAPAFDNPRYVGGGVDPNQQFGPPQQMGQPQGYGQQYPPQAYGYGQMQPYDQGQGYYPDYQNQPPPQGPLPPYGQGAMQAPPPQPAPQIQAPPPRQAQPMAQRSARPRGATPAQPDPYQGGRFGDPLPPGAARVTTTTPEGTSVQYYAPSITQEGDQYTGPSQQPRPRAASSPSRTSSKPRQETALQQEQAPRSSVAMPKPVTIPQGQDPRSGWNPN